MKNEQSNEYKLLKDFGEIVPEMIFENDSGDKIYIINVECDGISYSSPNYKDNKVSIHNFTRVLKLIYDPRNKSKEDIQKDIQKEICQKESELASLKEKLKELNKFKFVKGKFYKVRFDDKVLYGYYDGVVFNNFGNVYWVHHYDTYTDISNGNLGEKLEFVCEVLGDPTLSGLVSGNIKISDNLIKEDS